MLEVSYYLYKNGNWDGNVKLVVNIKGKMLIREVFGIKDIILV